jgi:hypothetical protein
MLLFACTAAPTAEPTPSPTPPPSPTEPLPANRARFVGVVMDEDSLTPLADVCVSGGKPGGCTWKSDAYGRFLVGDLPSGVWEFFFEKTGYQTTRREIVLVTAVVLSENVRMSK